MIETTCAFTGHRPSSYGFEYDETATDCIKIKSVMESQMRTLIENGVNTFLSGMAEGADIWGAEIALHLKTYFPDIRLTAVIPYLEQARAFKPDIKERYLNILDRCDEKIIVSPTYFTGCLQKRNRWLVDNAGYIIAVYNGSVKGGTADTVKYATKKRRSLFIIDPLNLSQY